MSEAPPTFALLALFALLPFVSTTLGGLAAFRFQHRLHPLMALAAGVVVATALTDLLPEAQKLVGAEIGRVPLAAAVLCGYLAFSGLDALLHAHAGPESPGHAHGEPIALVANPFGLVRSAGIIFHSTLDGMAIGIGFSSSMGLGLLVAAAVLAHDFADGLNVVTLALSAGQNRTTARVVLGLDAVAPAVGVAIGSQTAIAHEVLGVLLAIFAGVFLAIGAGHLLPEAQHGRPGIAPSLVLAAGVGAFIVLGVQYALG